MIDRRSLLTAGGASMVLAALGIPAEAFAAAGLTLSEPRPFSFERLVALAKSLGAKPYVADKSLPADVLERIDYDAHGKIKFNT
jgi:glucans biosynthesis protein